MTPYGHAGTQYPQPLHTSGCTTTVPNSVRNNEPVGHTSRHPAWVQCLQTSEDISHRKSMSSGPEGAAGSGGSSDERIVGIPRSVVPLAPPRGCSMKATWRQVLAL